MHVAGVHGADDVDFDVHFAVYFDINVDVYIYEHVHPVIDGFDWADLS